MPFKPEAAARTRVAKQIFVVKIIADNKIKKIDHDEKRFGQLFV